MNVSSLYTSQRKNRQEKHAKLHRRKSAEWNILFWSSLSQSINQSINTPLIPLWQSHIFYNKFIKKLCCREEHSASVVLSWCILWHLSEENLLMANQPLLRRAGSWCLRALQARKRLRALRTYICNVDLILVLFLLLASLLRNVVYVQNNYFFAQTAPKQRKLTL